MKTACFNRLFGGKLFILLLSFLGTIIINFDGFSQTEEPGMEAKPNNYTSFSLNRISNPKALPYNAPCIECEEDISERTEYTRVYKGTGKKTGKVYSQTGYSPIHIKDPDGSWITFDARLRKYSNGVYNAPDQHYPVKIDMNDGICSINNSLGEIKFNNRPELFWKNGTQMTSLGKANFSNYTAGDDGVYVTNVWPGIDMEMRVLMGALKTNFIIKNQPSQTSGVFIIRDEMILSNQLVLQKTEDELRVETLTGSEVFTISTCVGFDSHSSRENGLQIFNYELNGTIVDIVLPLAILNTPEFVYPYTVDPLVNSANTLAQASITGSQYNATCTFANSCNFNMNVPTPANAVITNAYWSFNYSSAGICWLSDGAVRFGVGSCTSPNMAGYYWFCNSNTSFNNCNGNNISLFSDISSCMPAPSCTPQNIPFQLRFFRKCYGSSGCASGCISAASPWTITLEGQTLEYTNTTTPITLSSTNVCQGQSLTVSTNGAYGVAPYTYNWSFSPTGTPSIGSGSSTTITFPTAGSQTLYSFVTDACGNVVTSSRVVTVTASPTVTATPNPANICSGGSPNIALTSTPTATTYNWTVTQAGVTGASASSGSTINQALTGTGSATYAVTGTIGTCTSTPVNVIVNVNPLPTATISGGGTYCAGGTVPPITISLTGTAPWTVGVSDGTTTQNLTITSSPHSFIPTGSGTYSIASVSDASCTGTGSGSATITVTPLDNATFNYSSTSFCTTGTNPIPTLSNPSMTGTFSGAGVVFTNTSNGTIDLLATGAGTYTVTFTTSGPCPNTSTQNITITASPIATFSYTSPVCQNGTNPSPILGSGATNGTYTAIPAGLSINNSTGLITLSSSTAGTYTVTNTIAASGGCATVSQTAPITINSLDNATFNYSSTSFCTTGTNPTPTLSNPSMTGTFSGTAVVFTNTSNGTINLAATGAGSYTVTFTTSGPCPNISSQNITITASPIATFTYTSPVCQNGTNPSPILGTGATNGAYTATPTGLSINNSTGVINLSASTPGTYTVTNTIAASGGCATVSQTAPITISPSPTAIISGGGNYCTGGNYPPITIQLTGNAPWSVVLSNGSTTQTLTINSSPYTYTPTSVGTYFLSSLSSGGCSGTVSGSANVVQAAGPTVNAGPDITRCFGTPIILTGQGAVSYTWNNGVVNGQAFTQPVGSVTYTVTGTDANGCTNSDQVVVTVVSSPAISVTNTQNVSCYGLADGSISVNVTGGAPTYNYNWSPSGGNGSIASNLSAGTYTLQVSDQAGCTNNVTVTITQPPQIVVTPTVIDYTCGITDGEITLAVTGGAGSYNFNWFPNVSTTNSATNLLGGNYFVVVTDVQGCSQTLSITVATIEGDLISIYADSYVLNEGDSTNLHADETPGVIYDSIVWTPAAGLSCTNCLDPVATPIGTTTYYATLYSPDGCIDTDTLTITITYPCSEVFVATLFSPNGDGLNDDHCVRGSCITKMQIMIFDRWGEIVFESKDQADCWDGNFRDKPAQTGVYVYKLTAMLTDGTYVEQSGNINLVR